MAWRPDCLARNALAVHRPWRELSRAIVFNGGSLARFLNTSWKLASAWLDDPPAWQTIGGDRPRVAEMRKIRLNGLRDLQVQTANCETLSSEQVKA
jgi:hypothetical protein